MTQCRLKLPEETPIPLKFYYLNAREYKIVNCRYNSVHVTSNHLVEFNLKFLMNLIFDTYKINK